MISTEPATHRRSRRRGGQSLEVLQHPLAVSDLARVED